jgi:hypothetical protein
MKWKRPHPCKKRKDGPPNFKGKKASEKIPAAIPKWLEVEGLEWNLLRGDQQLAEKFKTGWAAIEGFFSR